MIYIGWGDKSLSCVSLFSVNRETQKLITVFRDLRFLIAVNCARDTPLRPLIKALLMKHRQLCVFHICDLSLS